MVHHLPHALPRLHGDGTGARVRPGCTAPCLGTGREVRPGYPVLAGGEDPLRLLGRDSQPAEPAHPHVRDRLRSPPQGRGADCLPEPRPAHVGSPQRHRLPGPVAGQRQQGEQLRPDRSRHRTSDQAGGPPPEPGTRRPDRRDDLLRRGEGDRPQPTGSGDLDRRDHQRRRSAGDRFPEARRALGEPDERRLVGDPPQGPSRRLRRPGRCCRLLHDPKFVLGRVRLQLGSRPLPSLRDGALPVRPALPAGLRGG